jgi:hypothetical protein
MNKIDIRKYIYLSVFLAVFALFAPGVKAATLNLLTDKAIYQVGETFDVNVKISSADQGVNGAQAVVNFDSTMFDATKADKTGSVLDFWLTEPTISSGQVRFTAAATTGYTGQSLQVVKITFKAKGPGTSNISITDAAITASDGSGTNILTGVNNVTLAISGTVGKSAPTASQTTLVTRIATPAVGLPTKPEITVPLYPDPTKWYNVYSGFTALWKLPADISGIATALDQDPNSNPSKSEGLFDSKTFTISGDGIWYLHIRFMNNVGWGPVNTFQISIDTAPPAPFKLEVVEGILTSNPAPHITYKTGDALSGIDHYSITVDNNNPINTLGTIYALPLQSPGKHLVKVYAIDKAGNSAVNSVTVQIVEIPFLNILGISVTKSGLLFFSIIILIVIFGAGFFYYWFYNNVWDKQRDRKVVLAERDIINTIDSVQKNIDKMLKNYTDKKIDEREAAEMNFILNKMKTDLEKTQKYIVDSIKQINK